MRRFVSTTTRTSTYEYSIMFDAIQHTLLQRRGSAMSCSSSCSCFCKSLFYDHEGVAHLQFRNFIYMRQTTSGTVQ